MIPNILISIIVPIYNSEKTIERCVDSLIKQDYTNIEIILIDDGSKDRSGEICDQYKNRDNRIKVFHQENQGESSARNYGLKESKGEWITFCDSDDFVEKNYILSFFINKKIKQDILYITGMNRGTSLYNLKREHHYIIKNVINKEVLRSINDYGSVCGKLFNRYNIKKNGLKFNSNIFYGPDKVFTMQYLSFVDSVEYNGKLYTYNYIDDFNPKKYIKSFDEEIINYETIIDLLSQTWRDRFDPYWLITNFRFIFYSIFYQNDNKKERFNHIRFLVEQEKYSKDVLNEIMKEKSKKKIFFKWLLEGKYKRVDFIFSIIIPISINIFAKNTPIGIKTMLDKIKRS